MTTNYTTLALMQRMFSPDGVLAFSDHDESGISDTDVVEDCIDQASAEVDLYCRGRYSESGLAGARIIQRWATVLAVAFLCERRGNPVPESIAKEAERILEKLQQIQEGKLDLPGVAFGNDLRPAFSNLAIDRRYRYSRVRVTTENSSNQVPKMPRHDNQGPLYPNG